MCCGEVEEEVEVLALRTIDPPLQTPLYYCCTAVDHWGQPMLSLLQEGVEGKYRVCDLNIDVFSFDFYYILRTWTSFLGYTCLP